MNAMMNESLSSTSVSMEDELGGANRGFVKKDRKEEVHSGVIRNTIAISRVTCAE